jgi:cytochrome c oxidase cbb3-type subunit 4
MDLGEFRGWITVVTLLTFLGICWWAYRSGNRQRFEQDALLPFLDDPDALEPGDETVKAGGVESVGAARSARSHDHE